MLEVLHVDKDLISGLDLKANQIIDLVFGFVRDVALACVDVSVVVFDVHWEGQPFLLVIQSLELTEPHPAV